MQYQTIHAGRAVENTAWSRRLKYLPMVAMALLAAYGVVSHHVLAVALVLVAGVTFGYRLQHAAGAARRASTSDACAKKHAAAARRRISPGAPHVDGGSFSGNVGVAANSGRPTVLDGGTDRMPAHDGVPTGRAKAG